MAAIEITIPPPRFYEVAYANGNYLLTVGSAIYAILADDMGTQVPDNGTGNFFIFKSLNNGATWTDVTLGKTQKPGSGTVSVDVAVIGTVIYIVAMFSTPGATIKVYRWDTVGDDWLSDGAAGPIRPDAAYKAIFAAPQTASSEIIVATQTDLAVQYSVYNVTSNTWTTSLSTVYTGGNSLNLGSLAADQAGNVHFTLIRYDGAAFALPYVVVHISLSPSKVLGTAQNVFNGVNANRFASQALSPVNAYTDTNHGGASLAFIYVDHTTIHLFTAVEALNPTWSVQSVPTGENPSLLVPDNGLAADGGAISRVLGQSSGSNAILTVVWTSSGDPVIGNPYDSHTKRISYSTATATWGTVTTEWSSIAANTKGGPVYVTRNSNTVVGLFLTVDFDIFYDFVNKYASMELWSFAFSSTSTLALICNSPPAGQVGVAYTHAFPASSGTAPYIFGIVAGSIPPGLTLNTATGVVSGTPTTVGVYSFTVRVTDATTDTVQIDCSISITAAPTLVLLCGGPPAGTVGVSYSHTMPSSGGVPPYTFTISSGSLPNGLSINATTGVISGTPTNSGYFGFSVTLTDSVGTIISVTCSIQVGCPGGSRDDVHPYVSSYV